MDKYFGRLFTNMKEIYVHFCKIIVRENVIFSGVLIYFSLLNNFNDTTRMSEVNNYNHFEQPFLFCSKSTVKCVKCNKYHMENLSDRKDFPKNEEVWNLTST